MIGQDLPLSIIRGVNIHNHQLGDFNSDSVVKALGIASGLNDHATGTELLEVPTIYKAYFSGLCKGISPQNMANNMVLTYLHFRILGFPVMG